MDHKSEQILELIMENSRLSSREISRRIGIPITTVHNRIKKMKKDGIIKNYSVDLNYEKIGLGLCAYIMGAVNHSVKKEGSWDEIRKKIFSLGFVESVDVITGRNDLMIKVRAKNIKQLNKLLMKQLREVDGLDDSITMIVLEEASNKPRFL
jgi:Lrp/AsnC family transcriptional regulator for asnA, asnC and gidA